MKILFIVHQFYPEHYLGTEKFIFNLTTILQKQGITLKVLTYYVDDHISDFKSDNSFLFKEYTYKGIEIIAIRDKIMPINYNGRILNTFSDFSVQILKKINPDIIHIGHPMRLTEFINAAISLNIPYLMTLTDFWSICFRGILLTHKTNICAGPDEGKKCIVDCPEMGKDEILQRYINGQQILLNSKLLVSPSAFLASVYMQNNPALNVKVINHGLRYSKVASNKKTYKKGDQITFCYAGSLNHHKGVHVIIKAFTEIKAENIKLKIYGTGYDESYINNLRLMAENDNRIQFCGVFSEDEFGAILSQVDVVIIPSLWFENYPLVLHEALACCTPVIASNLGGMAEKIKNDFNGYVFNIGDYKDLKNIMEEIIKNPEKLEKLKNNINKFQNIPTLEQEAYVYLKEYRKILNGES
jgi:glycosyltransferase involved in cell wall biosynthesis